MGLAARESTYFGPERFRLGGVDRTTFGWRETCHSLPRRVLTTPPRHGLVGHRSPNPGFRNLDLLPSGKCREKGLLGQVLRLAAVTCHGQCDSEHGAVFPGKEALETLNDWLSGLRFNLSWHQPHRTTCRINDAKCLHDPQLARSGPGSSSKTSPPQRRADPQSSGFDPGSGADSKPGRRSFSGEMPADCPDPKSDPCSTCAPVPPGPDHQHINEPATTAIRRRDV